MKKSITGTSVLLLLTLCLGGCNTTSEKSTSFSIIYATAALLSLALLTACCCLVKKKRAWFIVLFSSVFIVNIGYTFLAVSTNLEIALTANRIAYFGSVFLPLSMLMIILNVTNTVYPKRLCYILGSLSLVVFLIAASPGILDIYYKEVSFAIVDGTSTLIKVYGPLHPIYLVYLMGYFSAMVAVIIRAQIKKSIDSTVHAVIVALAVFVNIGVWFIEQFVSIEFEMLSISYIISESFLLGVHLVIKENQRLKEVVRQVEAVHDYPQTPTSDVDAMLEKPLEAEALDPARIESFIQGLNRLTPTEKAVYEAHIARVTSKEIMLNLNIKENTLKYHNRNIYGKLGVSSKKELLEIHKLIQSAKMKLDQ